MRLSSTLTVGDIRDVVQELRDPSLEGLRRKMSPSQMDELIHQILQQLEQMRRWQEHG